MGHLHGLAFGPILAASRGGNGDEMTRHSFEQGVVTLKVVYRSNLGKNKQIGLE